MATAAAQGKLQRLKLQTTSHRFAFLLCSQFAVIAISPFAGNNGRRPGPAFTVFAMTLFLTALNLVVEKRRLRGIATVLCAAAIITGLLNSLGLERTLLIPGIVCAMVFMAFTTSVILWTIISATSVTRETLYGAVSVYLFVGITFSMAYAVVELLAPGSIRLTVETGRPLAWQDLSFFSFITLTTVGYGDVVPIGGVKALVMLEAVIGAMYPPILIGRLLTLYPSREERGS